eukprot:4324013-Amphidinium_carterae.2
MMHKASTHIAHGNMDLTSKRMKEPGHPSVNRTDSAACQQARLCPLSHCYAATELKQVTQN